MIITKKDKDAILNVLSDITELNGFGENYIKNINFQLIFFREQGPFGFLKY